MQTITRKQLAEVIGEKTLHIQNTDDLVARVAAYLSTEHLNIDLNSLVRDVMQYRQDRGIVEAVAVSAHPLNSTALNDIRELLKEHFPDAKTILVDQRIDESIVGGVRIELPQENLDLSVKSKLNLFKRLVAEERN